MTYQLIGQVLLGVFFVMSGFNHFKMKDMMAKVAKTKGVPAPNLAVLGTGTLLLLGGLSLLTGYQTFWGLTLLIVFLIPTSFMMHPFWKYSGNAKMENMRYFMSNMALTGALLLLYGLQTWPIALG
jgi:putative oxidoreductase